MKLSEISIGQKVKWLGRKRGKMRLYLGDPVIVEVIGFTPMGRVCFERGGRRRNALPADFEPIEKP